MQTLQKAAILNKLFHNTLPGAAGHPGILPFNKKFSQPQALLFLLSFYASRY